MKQIKNKSDVFYICLVGILLSLTLVFKAIFNYIPILLGYPVDVYISIYIISILMIKSNTYKWLYFLITPWVLLIIPSPIVNFWDLLLEYIVPLYIFFPMIYFYSIINLITYKVSNLNLKKTIELLVLALILLILFTLKLIFHVIAGYLWFTPLNWYASFIINVQIIFIIYAIDLPIIMLMYLSLQKFYVSFYGENKNKQKNSGSRL